MLRLDSRSPDFSAAFERFLSARREPEADVRESVATTVADVRARGDAALIDYTHRFDRLDLTAERLRIAPAEIDEAERATAPDVRAALALAARRIETFHRRQLPEGFVERDELGVERGLVWHAIEAVGLYVPGGTAAYPSSVLMNAIPAKAAGCRRIVMVAPTPDGVLRPEVLAAARLAGIDEIYCIGGAQAVAALAYGTASITPVDLIVGPGNAYVAEAKRQVFGQVGIDMIAGPSEILIVADAAQDPDWIAADLLSQAEHDTSAQSILITDTPALADGVAAAVDRQLAVLPRAAIAGPSWRDWGAVILVADLEEAVALVDRIAPEHLELMVEAPEALAGRIRNAGAIFLGAHTPEVIGDYVGGPNHVLPTGRSARFASGLSVFDFLRRTTLLRCPPEALTTLGPAAATLARAEGLEGHARAVELRARRAG